MSRLVLVVLVVLLGTTGCGRSSDLSTPEEIIKAVLAASKDGDYKAAARFFEGGQDRFRSSPDWMREYLDQITDKGNAKAFKVRDRMERGGNLHLQIATYIDDEMKQPLSVSVWSFVKKGSGWLITRVQ